MSLFQIVRLQSAHLPGYNAALSSSLRDGPIRGQAAAFSSDGFKGRRVLLIHVRFPLYHGSLFHPSIMQGTEDITVNPKYAPLILSMLPPDTRARSKLISVDGAGHDLTVSHCTLVADSLIAFFEGKETKT